MPPRPKVKDLVIVVPGMLGSRLLWNGKPVWGDRSPTVLEWVKKHGSELGRLSLGADDATVEDLGDGVTADGLIEGSLVFGRFLKIGGYGPLTRFLAHELALKLGENLQLFAYDWRRDLRLTARRLAVRAEGWLQSWRARSGNRDAKIVLIGHAMGGLVARCYADVEGGWPVVRRIISIGAPFLGSVRALDVLYFGLDFQAYGLSVHDLTPVARTLTSIYELLPQYPAVRTFTGELVSPFELRIPTFEQQKMDRARQFHRDLLDHHNRNRSAEGYAAMRSTVIAGVAQPTVEEARLLANGTLSVQQDAFETALDGDGAVPRFSAENEGHGGFESHSLYLPQSHGALVTDPVVHAHLRDLLSERRPGDPPPRAALPRFTMRRSEAGRLRIECDALALHVNRPFYKVGQPVELRVAARSAAGIPVDSRRLRIVARVDQMERVGKRVASARIRLSPVNGHAGWFAGRLRAAAPGTYRVMALSNERLFSGFRVSEFFEVYGGK